MTHTAEARRWKLVALASLALLVGYIAGQLSPSATAQQGVTKVQLDTSNCTFGVTRFVSELQGTFVVQVDPTATPGINSYVYTVCQ